MVGNFNNTCKTTMFDKTLKILSLLTIFFIGTLLTGTCAYAETNNEPKLILQSASELDYPPFALVKPDGTADGFSVDLLKAVVKAIDLEVDITVGPWHDIKQKLTEGHLDVLPLVSYTPERDKLYDFTNPYLHVNGTIFVRKEELSIRSEADLNGKEVIVMRDDSSHEYAVSKNIPARLILTNSFEEAMKLLSSGKHDAVLCMDLMGKQLIKKLGIENITSVLGDELADMRPKGKQVSGFSQKFGLAVPEGKKELLARLNEGLAIVIADGTYDALYKKWFDPILPKTKIFFTPEEKAWIKEHPIIRVSLNQQNIPRAFTDERGEIKGINVDFAHLIEQKSGLKINLVGSNWPTALDRAFKYEVDAIMNAAAIEERKKHLNFTDFYISTPQTVVGLEGKLTISGLDDMCDRKMAIIRNTSQARYLKDNFPCIELVEVNNIGEILTAIETGKADGGLENFDTLMSKIREMMLANLKPVYMKYLPPTGFARIGVRKDEPLLLSILNKAIGAITLEERNRIFVKWLGSSPTLFSEKDGPFLTDEEKAWLKESHSVRVRITNFPPYIIPKQNGTPEGIAIDYLNLIAQRTGVKFNYYSSGKPFSEALEGLKKHQGPDLISTMMSTPERQKTILFSKQFFASPYVIFMRADDKRFITAMPDLADKTIASVKGTVLTEMMLRDYPNSNFVYFKNDIQAIEAVSNQQADTYIGNLTLASYHILSKGLYNMKIAAPSPFGDHEFSMGIRNDWPQLVSIINKGLDSITQEEQLAIRNKYISIKYDQSNNVDIFKWFIVAAGISSGIILLFLFWNRSLKNQVSKRTADLLEEISERKQAEEQLRKSENRFRDLAENLSDFIWEFDENDIFTYASPGVKNLLGYTSDEIIGKSAFELMPSSEREKVRKEFTPLKEKRESFSHLLNVNMHKNGKLVVLESSGVPTFDNDGNYKGYRGIDRNITERKNAEKALAESEERFRLHFQNAPMPYQSLNYDGFFIDVNPAWLETLGYKREEVIGKSFGDFLLPEMEEHFKYNFPRFKDKGEILGVEFEMVKKDGSVIMVRFNGKIGYDEKGNFKQTHCIFQDITEARKAEKEKEKLEIRLRQAQKMEAIGTLAGGIAHDFNNILGVILGYADMAKEDVPADTKYAKDLEKVLIAGNRAKDLVKQILAFSRQSDIERVPIQLQSLVKESLKILRASIPTTIEIQNEIDSHCGVVLADPTQVHQVLMNLCTNANHSMEDSGGTLKIELKKVLIDKGPEQKSLNIAPGEYVELIVSDTGCGIGPDVIDNIFDPYFTTKEAGKGTGMGLAIIHGIMAEYGGSITVESKLGEGSAFHVYFPVVANEELPADKVAKEIPMGYEHILFIDDEELLAEMGQDMLERLGYTVTVRKSSLDALSTFQNNPKDFDVVITDQTMPGITGSDLARRFLQIRPDIPIILCTGYSNLIDEVSAKAVGIREFALKPLTKGVIAKLIRKVLDGE